MITSLWVSRCHFSLYGVSRFHPKSKLKVTLHSEVLLKLHDKWRLSVEKQGGHIFEKPNSLRFPGHFKFLREQLKKGKFNGMHFCWRSCHIFFIFAEFSTFFPQKFKFPRVFHEVLTISQIPWVSQVFHVFAILKTDAPEAKVCGSLYEL